MQCFIKSKYVLYMEKHTKVIELKNSLIKTNMGQGISDTW